MHSSALFIKIGMQLFQSILLGILLGPVLIRYDTILKSYLVEYSGSLWFLLFLPFHSFKCQILSIHPPFTPNGQMKINVSVTGCCFIVPTSMTTLGTNYTASCVHKILKAFRKPQ